MTTSNNRDVRLRLGVDVEGAEDVEKLASELDALAAEGKSTAGAFEAGGVAAGQLQDALQNLTTATKQQRATEAAAQVDAKAARQTLDQQREALARLRIEYATSGGDAQKYKADVLQLRTAILDSRAAVRQKQEALSAATAAARAASGAEEKLVSEIRAATSAVRAQAPAYREVSAASTAATQQQIAQQKALRDSVASVGKQLQSIQQIATIALGGSYAGGLIKDLGETADEFQNLSARIKLATGEGQQLDSAMAGVVEVSLQTHGALEQTATLFSRLTKAGTEAGLSAQAAQVQALGLTETINQAVQLSGSSADASNAAITQLIQGLQSGVLRGEEFNSVMEQAPRLAQALSQGLNVTTGELRKMAEQGQLTTATVISALQGQADVVNAEFQKLPLTIGRALQDLRTQWTLYVGASDNGMVSSQNAAKVIEALSTNLDSLVTVLFAAGKAWAAFKIAGLAGDVLTWAMNTNRATTATEAHTAAAVANTVAERTNTAAQNENTAAVARNAAARSGSAAAIAATTAAATAGAGAQAALGAQTAAAAGKAASAGIVWRGFTGLFGPWGLVLAALIPEIKGIGVAIGETAAKWMGWEKVLKASEDKLRAQEEATKALIEAKTRENRLLQEARDKQFELTKTAAGLIAKFEEMRSKGDSAAESIDKIGKNFDLSSVPGIRDASAVLDKLLTEGKLTAEQFREAWEKALDGKDLAVFEVEARAALKGITREAEQLAQIMGASLRAAVKRTGIEFEVLQGGISAASRSASNDIDVVIQGLEKLKAQGVDTARVLSTQFSKAISTADSEKALEELRAKIESVRNVLGDKIADGLLDQAAQKAVALKDALDEALPGIQGVREAMRQLGVTSDEALRNTALQSEKAYRVLTESGKASARELTEAFKKYAADAIAANGGVASEAIKTEAAMRGLVVATDAAGKAIVQTAEQAEQALGRVGQAYGRTGDAAESASERATRALERQINEQERLNAALERAAELERKRRGVDKQGFAADQNGNRLEFNGNPAPYKDPRSGNWFYTDDRGQLVRGGTNEPMQDTNGNWFDPLAKAGIAPAGDATDSNDDPAAGLPTKPNDPKGPAARAVSTTHTVNLNLPGKSASVKVVSAADANTLTGFLRELEYAASASS